MYNVHSYVLFFFILNLCCQWHPQTDGCFRGLTAPFHKQEKGQTTANCVRWDWRGMNLVGESNCFPFIECSKRGSDKITYSRPKGRAGLYKPEEGTGRFRPPCGILWGALAAGPRGQRARAPAAVAGGRRRPQRLHRGPRATRPPPTV
jgi:hypothetical protein